MPAYLVRTIDEHDLVGVFYAPNVYSLAFMIDEVLDPDDCEYLLIGPGGIVWSSPAVEIPVPPREDDDDPSASDPVPWQGAGFTESWWMFVYTAKSAGEKSSTPSKIFTVLIRKNPIRILPHLAEELAKYCRSKSARRMMAASLDRRAR